MGTHYQPGGFIPGTDQREQHPDLEQYEEAVAAAELEYLRTENKRLNQDNVRLRDEVREKHREIITLRNGMEKDLLIRRLRLDVMHSSIRNLQLMARIAWVHKRLKDLEAEVDAYIQSKRKTGL